MYKCNEQRTLNSNLNFYKEGRKYIISKNLGVVELTEKELIKLYENIKSICRNRRK
jgi:hypothetical protein